MTAIATVNNGVDEDTVTVGMATTVDLATYHSAGQETITYGKPTNADAAVFDAELTGSMLKLTPKEMQPGGQAAYAIEIFTVVIKDSDASGKVLTETSLAVRVRRNQQPSGADAAVEREVGSQAPATALDATPACTASGVRPDCYVEVEFMDEDGAAIEVLTFVATVADDDADKVEVVSAAAAPDNVLQARVVVRGLKTTQGETADEPVTVTITATDDGGLTAERTAEVSVNEAPRPKGTMPNRTMKQSAPAAERILVADASAFFEDPEGQTLTYTVSAKDAQKANATIENDGSALTVTPNGIGSTEITVTATESSAPTQSGTQTFTVTIGE
jgi:hypothetical protein